MQPLNGSDVCLWAAMYCVREEEVRQKERDALGAQKTTLSKEGFKEYQLRLLGNL